MARTRLLLLVALVLLLAVVLTLPLKGMARTAIAMPLLYIGWLASLVFSSIPQWLWWVWFLTMAVIIVAKSFNRSTRVHRARRDEIVPEGVVWAWARRVRMAGRGEYFRWRLAHDLAQLGLDLLAYRDRRGLARYDRRTYIEALSAPSEVRAYFRIGVTLQSAGPLSLLSRLTRLWGWDTAISPLGLDPVKAVQFLEDQLENKDDG